MQDIVIPWNLFLINVCVCWGLEDLFLTWSDDVDDKILTEHFHINDSHSLICWYCSNRALHDFNWYHQFLNYYSSSEWTEIPNNSYYTYSGWRSRVEYISPYQKLMLSRDSHTVAIEGYFACNIGGRDGKTVTVGIHYPILSVKGSLQTMVNRANGIFKVICTSTGGRPLTMSVTGPSGVVEDMVNIVVEGDMEGMGNDTLSAEFIKKNAKHGDLYICTASNVVSNSSSTGFILKVASNPNILIVVQTSATSVIVEWSQPSGGATVTGYVVHYSDGVTNMTESVPASSISLLVTNLTNCHNYTFSVEALSEHLSGTSDIHIMDLGVFQLAVNVTAEAESSTVISVKWDYLRACSQVFHLLVNFAVEYTVMSTGIVSKTRQLNATLTKAQLTGLMPYTNYSIRVAVVNEMVDVGPYSYPVIVQTPEDVPGPIGAIMVSPSQSQVSLSWDPPLMPNGIIIAYEVSYRPTASSEPETRVNTTALVTHFTTEDNLEEDTEFLFSVRAYTRVGPGNFSSLTVSTLPASKSYLNFIVIALIVTGICIGAIGLTVFGIAIVCVKAKRSPSTVKSNVDIKDNPAYDEALGLKSDPLNSSPAIKQEPVYDTILF